MSLVSPSQSNPGDTIDASDINNPINQIAAVVNGNIDATNIAANGVASTQLADGAVTGSKIATYKVLRRDNTTNSTEITAKIQTGWLAHTNTVVTSLSGTITFPTAFINLPIVTATVGGDHGTLNTYGSGAISLAGGIMVEIYSITVTTFNYYLKKQDGTTFAAGYTFLQWIAIGT